MLLPLRLTLARPVKSSVLVNRLPHCDWSRLTTLRSSPSDSNRAPCVDRKWTWGVAAVPAPGVHIDPSLDTQVQLLLARLDSDLSAQRCVLESTSHVDNDVATGKPTLAAAIYVGVGDLPKSHVTAHIHMPRVEIGVYLVRVAVRLVWDAFRRPEVNPAWRTGRLVFVIDYPDLYPVAAAVGQRRS